MNKLAVFVEGQTEQLFVEKLLQAIAGEKSITIEKRKAAGGGASAKRHCRFVEVSAARGDEQYYAMIVDCGTDSKVKSDIRERYERLTDSGFSTIIGIRDVYPIEREQIGQDSVNFFL